MAADNRGRDTGVDVAESVELFTRNLDSSGNWHHDANMRTTIDINDALLRDLRNHARKRGVSFRVATEEVLLLGLARKSKQEVSQRFNVRPHRLGIKRGYQGQSMNQLYDQLEAENDVAGG